MAIQSTPSSASGLYGKTSRPLFGAGTSPSKTSSSPNQDTFTRQAVAGNSNQSSNDDEDDYSVATDQGVEGDFFALRRKCQAVTGNSSQSINVNQADNEGDTPLGVAAGGGHADNVEALLTEPEINVNQADRAGGIPLGVAAGGGHADNVEALLTEPGINVNQADRAVGKALRDVAALAGC
jgi:ankyrin repeat protein